MTTRLAVLTATVAAALVAAAPALANAPFWTQAPSLSIQGGQLVGSNGGWTSYSHARAIFHAREEFDDDFDEGGTPQSSKHWRLLVLEDTGELLTPDAKSIIGQGLSRF